jgi:hypothetical protein
MARAIKGYHYSAYQAFALRHEVDVERLSPQAMRSYLRANLRLIEAQIRVLSDQLDTQAGHVAPRWSVPQKPQQDDRWTSLASLSYLMATRDALRKAIDTL